MHCTHCRTKVESRFEPTALLRLSPEQQELAVKFILASGNLKELAIQEGVSYPTIRGRIDRLMEILRSEKSADADRRSAILDAVEEKRITADDAAKLLKKS